MKVKLDHWFFKGPIYFIVIIIVLLLVSYSIRSTENTNRIHIQLSDANNSTILIDSITTVLKMLSYSTAIVYPTMKQSNVFKVDKYKAESLYNRIRTSLSLEEFATYLELPWTRLDVYEQAFSSEFTSLKEFNQYLSVPEDNLTPHYIEHLENKVVDFKGRSYLFAFFKLLENPNGYESADIMGCWNCPGKLGVSRFVLRNNKYELEDVNYDCSCGSKRNWGKVSIPNFIVVEDKYLLLEDEDNVIRGSTNYGWLNICNALDFNKYKTFSTGGVLEGKNVETEVNYDSYEYDLILGKPVIFTTDKFGRRNMIKLKELN